MKILITGTGLIGCYTAAQLIDSGHEVVLYDLAPHANYIEKVLGKRKVTVRQGDITRIQELVDFQHYCNSDQQIEMVVHTSGLIGGVARANPYSALRTNLIGTIELLEASRRVGVKRIIYASTHGVYALDKIREAPFDERAQLSAESIYGATKLASEHILESFGEASGIQMVALRFTNIYGFGEFVGGSSGGSSFQQLVTAGIEECSITIPPSLIGFGEWLYVKDAALAVQNALEHPLTKTFTLANIGSGVLVDENDIVRTLKEVLPMSKFVASSPKQSSIRLTQRFQPFDMTTARDEIGFSPTFNLIEGIRDYVSVLEDGTH